MSNETFELGGNHSSSLQGGRRARWARRAAVLATVAVSLGTLGATSSSAEGITAQAATVTPLTLSVSTATAIASRLGVFDASLLKMINAKRAAVGAVALREVVGLDNVSATWSISVIALGRYGKVVANPNVAAQTLSAAPTRVAFAQSVAKWYPQTVKAVDVFALYTAYPKALADMTNRSYKFVGIRTAAAVDGTSVATLTYTDNAIAAQIVDPTARVGKLIGNADTLRQSGTQLTTSGWGYDTAAPTAALKATVVLTGRSGTRTSAILLNANRPDIARIFAGAGAAHGYRIAVPNLGKGLTTMCVTLLPASASAAKKLTCRSITVS